MKNPKKRGLSKASRSSIEKDDDIFSSRNVPYEPSDSEDDYSQQDKMLLEKVRSSTSQIKSKKKVAVMDLPLYEEDDDNDVKDSANSDGDDEDVDMDSDIEGKGDHFNLPDQRAWGKTRRNYYNTDYVDQDYGGFDGEDAEAAELEEQEAREIQKRLAAELDDNDFTLDVFTQSKEEDQPSSKISEEVIKTDLSQLSSRQKLALLEKEAPELIGIITEFKDVMEELQSTLQPAMALVQKYQVTSTNLVHYIRTKYHLVNNYVMNMGFYLLLRARRLPVAAHPVVKRLLQYRQLLQQLEPLEKIASDQLNELLDSAKNGLLPVLQDDKLESKKQKKAHLKLLNLGKLTEKLQGGGSAIAEIGRPNKLNDKEKLKAKSVKFDESSSKNLNENESKMPWENGLNEEDNGGVPWNSGFGSDGEDGGEGMDESGGLDGLEQDEDGEESNNRRAITWQIAKNKGLTPHRKKEQRNPRVKHRNKFRKAKIRRKGQVREPRTEVKRYGGEMSGIKKTVTKSVKIK